jgi:DNA-binding transcriptional LysR family regulator
MNRQLVWDDLRLILTVVEVGTLAGAGRRLGLSHATVYRRLGQIEGRLGVKLFDRARTGYAATLAGEEVALAARRIETEVLDIERRIVGRDLRPSGTVRVTTTDTLFVGLLSPIFAEFQRCIPGYFVGDRGFERTL